MKLIKVVMYNTFFLFLGNGKTEGMHLMQADDRFGLVTVKKKKITEIFVCSVFNYSYLI